MSRPCKSLAFIALIGLVATACDNPQSPAPPPIDPPSFRSADLTAAGSYLLTASKWSGKQTKAVQKAGGSVLWSHGKTGIGVATSQRPDFLEKVMASGAFRDGGADVMVQWQPPVRAQRFAEATVTPGDETFFAFQWNMVSIDAPGAWAASADGSGARVAVIDGGLYNLHADIAPNLDAACSASFVPGQPYNNDVGTFWHGTHVAGIIVAADNGFGVIGVAPRATLMHVKALHDGSGSFGAVIAGILFASDPASFAGYEGCERADIINLSLGVVFPKSEFPGFLAATAKAVNFAASKGVLVLSAAGNEGLDLGQSKNLVAIPAQSGSGLAVAATGPVDFAGGGTNFRRFASYSNYGEDLVDLAGPGGDFTLAPNGLWFFDMVLSTCRGMFSPPTFSFCFAAGTSMATPAAAGVAALIVGKNPGISLGNLKTALLKSTDDEGKRGSDELYGRGFVNAAKAVH